MLMLKEIKYLIAVPSTNPNASLLLYHLAAAIVAN